MKLENLAPEIQKAFKADDEKVRINNSIGGCWLALTLMPAGIMLDYFVYPEHLWFFFKLRLFCSLAVGVVLVLFYTPIGKKYHLLLGQIWYLLPAFFISWMIYASEGANSSYYAGLNIVLVAVGLMLPWTYQENLMGGLLVMAMYLGACAFHGPFAFKGEFFNNIYFLFLTDIIVVVGSYFSGQLRLREFVSRFELDKNRAMLEDSNRKLVELDQVKSRFFANISHELRTPLTLLIGPLETLQWEKANLLDEESKETLRTMFSNGMRLLKLINDLLDLVKLESGRMESKREIVKLDEFVKGLAQSIQNTAKDKGVRLLTKVHGKIGAVLADKDKLEKIILNLLFNALKFTPAGGEVDLTVRRTDDWLEIQVSDTGMGISAKNLPYIFDRFWQADSASNRKYQGTGIGLALVKELTEAQGGKVEVESQVSHGTSMTIKIPYVEATAEAISAEESKHLEALGSAPAPDEWLAKLYRRAELFPTLTPLSETVVHDNFSQGKKPKLLVADDEPDMLRFLKSQLEKYYEVIEAVDGNQAVEKVKQFLPEVVLLDMMMPEKDGITVCRELKSITSTQSIPIILLTARADDETKMAALNAGASDFLTKPFSSTELHVRVNNLVESHRLQLDLARQKNSLEQTLEQLKETEGQLVQNEKMASLGKMSAGIIHEINNPLNYAVSALHLLKMRKDKLPEAEQAKYMEIVSDIEEGVGRVQNIVSDLRTFTHPHSAGVDWVDLSGVLSKSMRLLSQELKEPIHVEVVVPAEHRVMADQNRLIQVFVNLLQNSADALKEKQFDGEKPLISIQSASDDGVMKVKIRDNGMGIETKNMNKVFDPFFTTKDVGMGMGLGLSICYKIIREQGGNISVKSVKGKFTEFLLELPAKA